jgi:glycosyltransferase involved in cell wall biosynthesis
MSVYNGEKYINKSVNSILRQSYLNYECIIINDGSKDDTKTILESISDSRIKIIHQANNGPGAARNRGIQAARGEYIAIMDSDDISLPVRLEKQVDFLDKNKDYVLIGSNSNLINEIDEHIGIYKLPTSDTEIRWALLFRNPYCHSTVMIRGDILRKNKIYYNEKLLAAQDFDLLTRLLNFGRTENIEQPLLNYRVHPDQIGKYHIAEQQKNALLISKLNLENIGFNLTEGEVLKLRKWAYEFPSGFQKEDIPLCDLLLHILRVFKSQPYVDLKTYKDIENDYISKICKAINKGNISKILFSSLIIHIISINGLLCLKYMKDRALSKLFGCQ